MDKQNMVTGFVAFRVRNSHDHRVVLSVTKEIWMLTAKARGWFKSHIDFKTSSRVLTWFRSVLLTM